MRRSILSSLRVRLALWSICLPMLVLGAITIVATQTGRRMVNARWSRLMLLEAETKVRIQQDAAEWHAMHADGREHFIEAEEILPVCMLLFQGEVEFGTRNWPSSLTLDQFPLSTFRKGELARPPKSDASNPARKGWGEPRPSMIFDQMVDGEPWRFGMAGFEERVFILGYAHEELFREPMYIERMMKMCNVILIVSLGLSGWLVGCRAMRPISRIVATTREIKGSTIKARVNMSSWSSELDELVDVINAMLDRLERSFNHSRRFTSDVSHELKTPITILYGRVNRGLQYAKTEEDQLLFAGLLGEVERLNAIVEKLLLLSQADSGELVLNKRNIDLSELVLVLCEDMEHLKESVKISSRIEPGIYVKGDQALLGQVFHNLASNAVKYAVGDSMVEVELRRDKKRARFIISNAAEEISEAERERIFERFYRVDQSRNRLKAGAGLGLSLAREIVHVHSGDIDLDLSRLGYAVFNVDLPAL